MKIAEFRLTNEREQRDCETDLMRNMGLSQAEARTVAAAYRAQVLPTVAQYEGLGGEDYAKLVRLSGLEGRMTADFAKGADHGSDEAIDDTDDELDDMDGDVDGGIADEAAGESLGDEIGEHGHVPTSAEEAEEGETPQMHSPEVETAIEDADAAAGGGDALGGGDATTGLNGPDNASFDDGTGEDLSNGGTDTATFEVEVPADLVDDFQKFLADFQSQHGGGGDLDMTEDDAAMDADTDAAAAPALGGATGDETESAAGGVETSDNALPLNGAASRKVQPTVDKNVLAKRRAMREQILARVAQSQNIAEPKTEKRDVKHGDDTSGGTYMGERATSISYASDAQYSTEESYPTLTMEGSEGNSMKKDNPDFGKLKIPTRNPENLGLKDSYEAVRKEGDSAGDDVLSYEVDLDKLDWIPSKNPDREKAFPIPTQMDQRDRNTNVQQGARQASTTGYDVEDISEAEDALYTALRSAGVADEQIGNLTMAQAISLLGQRVASTSDVAIEVNAQEPEVPAENKGVKHDGGGFERKPHETDESRSSRSKEASSEVFQARLKTAWAITAKLCRAGLIAEEDMDSNVQMWMNDGMSVQSMISTGTQFLRMAQTASERVLEAAATRNQPAQRTASVATNPVITPTASPAPVSVPTYGGQSDLMQALRSVLSNNDEYERYFADEEAQGRVRRPY
jgi:hypothetical protein